MTISVTKEDQLDKDGKKIDDIAVITKTIETTSTESISRTQLISTRTNLVTKAKPLTDKIEEIDIILGILDG